MLAGILVLLVAAGAAVWVTDPFDLFGGTERTATFRKIDPREAHRAKLQTILDARAEALLTGDEKGWLAAVDPTDEKLVADQRRMFVLLREMGVEVYGYEVLTTAGLPGGSVPMKANVSIGYCFGRAECLPVRSKVVLSLRAPGLDVLISGYKPDGEPRPWVVSDLRVAAGSRVVVAAQPRYEDRLGRFRREADRAAKYAARFGPRQGTFGKQLIFLGGPDSEADTWYHGHIEKTTGGRFNAQVGPWRSDYSATITGVEHVVNAREARHVRYLVRWLLASGAALLGTEGDTSDFRWLRSGIAEYAASPDDDPADYPIADDLRTVLRRWKGDLSDLTVRGFASEEQFRTAAWVAVYRLIDRYGEKEFIAFYNAVARQGAEYGVAAEEHLGRSLEKVQSDVLRYMRSLT